MLVKLSIFATTSSQKSKGIIRKPWTSYVSRRLISVPHFCSALILVALIFHLAARFEKVGGNLDMGKTPNTDSGPELRIDPGTLDVQSYPQRADADAGFRSSSAGVTPIPPV